MDVHWKMEEENNLYSVEKVKLNVPPFEELCEVLQDGLKEAFEDVAVNIAECPDLREPPFHLVAKGLCGSPRIADVGGNSNLIPVPQKDKIYNLDAIAAKAELPGAFMIGAGAGPFHKIGVSSEFIANARATGGVEPADNQSYIAKIDAKTESFHLFHFPETTDVAFMINLLLCEGNPGEVLEVKCRKRTKETNLISCMREALAKKYGTDSIGLGGVFLIQQGKAKLHVQPDFSPTPLDDVTVNSWLKYFVMSAPLVCLSVFVSHDPGLDLRLEHTHCFSLHGEGGHYHEDTTPDEVEYLGYFVPAEFLYRIDQPKKLIDEKKL